MLNKRKKESASETVVEEQAAPPETVTVWVCADCQKHLTVSPNDPSQTATERPVACPACGSTAANKVEVEVEA